MIRFSFTVPGEPVAHERPRLGRGHVYTPKKSSDYKDQVASLVKGATRARGQECPFKVEAEFFRSTYHRIDLDNLLKSILDGCTRSGLWKDDSQVHAVAGRIHLGDSCPRAEVTIEEMESQLPKCVECGKAIPMRLVKEFRAGRRNVCSMACRIAAATETKTCVECGRPFSRKRSLAQKQERCSRECRSKYITRVRWGKRAEVLPEDGTLASIETQAGKALTA